MHTPGFLNFILEIRGCYARFENITLKLWNFYSVDGMFPQQVRVNFVRSAYKLRGSLFIGVCVCVRPYDIHFHIVNTFRAYAPCHIYVEPFIMIWHVVVELLNLRPQQINPSKRFIFFMFIDIQIAHYGCVTMSENCHVLCSIM